MCRGIDHLNISQANGADGCREKRMNSFHSSQLLLAPNMLWGQLATLMQGIWCSPDYSIIHQREKSMASLTLGRSRNAQFMQPALPSCQGVPRFGQGFLQYIQYIQRSAKVFFLGCVTRPLGSEGESRHLGKRLQPISVCSNLHNLSRHEVNYVN